MADAGPLIESVLFELLAHPSIELFLRPVAEAYPEVAEARDRRRLPTATRPPSRTARPARRRRSTARSSSGPWTSTPSRAARRAATTRATASRARGAAAPRPRRRPRPAPRAQVSAERCARRVRRVFLNCARAAPASRAAEPPRRRRRARGADAVSIVGERFNEQSPQYRELARHLRTHFDEMWARVVAEPLTPRGAGVRPRKPRPRDPPRSSVGSRRAARRRRTRASPRRAGATGSSASPAARS